MSAFERITDSSRTSRHVRFVPFSDLGARSCEVRCTLKNRRRQPILSGPKSANNRSAGRFAGNLFPRVRLGTSNLNSFCQLL